jgi:LuxR family glucitol operon transcriptional activator
LQQIVDDLYAARGDLFDDLFSRAWALLDEAGKRILMVMTFFPDSASSEALSATADVIGFDFDRAAERLTDLSLLDVQQADLTSTPRYVLHPLVRTFAAAQLVEQADFERAARERWVEWCVAITKHDTWWKDVHWVEQFTPEVTTVDAALDYVTQQQQIVDWLPVWYMSLATARYYTMQGPWERSMALRLQQAQAARVLGNLKGEMHALTDYVESASLRGEFEKAEERLGEIQRNIGSAHDVPSIASKVQQALAVYSYHQGKVEQALAITEDIKRIVSREADLPATRQPWNLYMHALCLKVLGRVEEAQQGFLAALQDAVRASYIRGQIFPRIELASIALDTEQFDEAQRFLDEGQALASQSGDRRLLGPIRRCYARLHSLRGNLPAARSVLTEAIDLFERLGMRRELAEAREELARLEAQMAEAAE